jgi:thiosulfate dehydrogenase [quinone] large subunit
MLLSLTFFLSVSWATTPYYYGSDIVFLFAWSVFATCGAGGVLSLDAWIDARAGQERRPSERPIDEVRRRILVSARSTALLAGIAGLLGGATAVIGRAIGGTRPTALATLLGRPNVGPLASQPDPRPHSPSPRPTASDLASSRNARTRPPGTALAPLSAVPVGEARRFTDPASGQPAWVLRPSRSKVVAFSAVCTHAGCSVGYEPSAGEFVCPCHGGRFSATSGAVLGGPPPAPLTQIPARIVNNEIRVD